MEFINVFRDAIGQAMGGITRANHAIGATALFCLALSLLSGWARAAPPAGYTFSWSDEFALPVGSKPDASRWAYDLGAGGWGNNELQTYVNDTQHAQMISDDAADGGTALRIQATKDTQSRYHSARIKTQGKVSFQYGYIEARIRMPYGQGIWPAFWMLGTDIGTAGWPACGEIDVMENIGREPAIVHGTLHGPGYSGGNGIGGAYTLPGGQQFKDAYHTFAMRWRPDAFTFYVDGAEFKTITSANIPSGSAWVFNKPFFFILNLAVGGNWPGYPDATTVFPQEYRVDYVRVYKFNPPIGRTITLKSLANSKFVSAGSSPLIADQTSAGTGQQFQIIDAGNGYVALKSMANKLYVSAPSITAPLNANKAAIGTSEQFEWVDAGNGNVALKARSISRYVCADNTGASPLIANRTAVSTWESFAVSVVPPPDPAVLADAASALTATGGLDQPSAFEAGRLNVNNAAPSESVVDVQDGVRLARRAVGTDTF